MQTARSDRRDEILDAMLAMVAEEGPDRVTTRGLARRVGITEPVLYRQFAGGKAEMWHALAGRVGEAMQAAWRRALADAGGIALERLRALIGAQMRTIADIPALPAILFSRTLHRDNAALRAGLGEVAGRLHARIEQLVCEGQAHGELRADVDPDATAWLLIATIQGTAIRWSLSERAFELEPEGARVLEVALAGLRARGHGMPARPGER
ncbi:MAG: TetR family transcriptional regulator [Halofilum sp. (in: g-proteobacteria)]|nr:TetR family transcriptional regulator [Halofilum sp. (in: g-proteobacteria)]